MNATIPPPHLLTTDTFRAWCLETGAADRPTLGAGPAMPAAVPVPPDQLAPPRWEAYIGQEAACDELRVRAQSAKARAATMPPVLLTGPAGFGKTTLARLTAAELGRPLVELHKPMSARGIAEELLLTGEELTVLFVDEVHTWSHRGSEGQHDLMQLTEDHTLTVDGNRISFPGVSVIAATTDPEALRGPLTDRFGCTPRFESYSPPEMRQIVAGLAYRAGLDVPQVTVEFQEALAVASAGSPRQARHLVLAALDLHTAGRCCEGPAVVEFCGITPDGLTADHLDYLRALAASAKGAVSDKTMGHILGLSTAKVRIVERLLLDRHYIAITNAGRKLTPAAHTRLSQEP